jgi:hypothetical protein
MKSLMRRTTLIVPLGLALAATGLVVGARPAGAQERSGRWVAQERRDDRRFEDRRDRREIERRDFERHAAPWRFERGHGWRFERSAGVWSPYYAWWWIDQRVVLLAAPTATVVQYPTGRYELRGDGVSVPYYWVWLPTQPVIAAPAPPPVGAPAPPDVAVPGPPPPPPAG